MIISSAALVLCLLCCSSLDFKTSSFSWHFLKYCLHPHLCLTQSLDVEVSESRSFSSNLLYFDLHLHWRELCPWSTRVPLTILLSLKQCHPQLLRSGAKDLVRRWTCWFHQIFASSASSKKKVGKKFSCGFSSRQRKFDKDESLLAIKQQDRERFACANKISHRDSHYMWQLAVNFN